MGPELSSALGLPNGGEPSPEPGDGAPVQRQAQPMPPWATSTPAMIARDATDGAPPPKEVPAAVTHALASEAGTPLPDAERWSERIGADVSGVNLVTGASADAAARSIHANAFTVGQRVFFADGKSGSGNDDLIEHELRHTVQQRDAAVGSYGDLRITTPSDPAERDARAGASASHGAAIARDPESCDARAWLGRNASRLAEALGAKPSFCTVASTGSTYATFQGGGAAAIVSAITSELIKGGLTYAKLAAALSPVSPDDAINRGRDAEADGAGPSEYNANVATELQNALRPIVLARVPLVIGKYIQARSQAIYAVQSASTPTPQQLETQPAATAIIAEHPLDRSIVAPLVAGTGVTVDFERYWSDNPAERTKRDQLLRPVSLEFQAGSGNWMWVRTTLPAGAVEQARPIAAAETAQALYGDTAMAHLLTGKSPLFGFQLPPSGKLAPGVDERWRAAIAASSTPSNANPVAVSGGGSPSAQVAAGKDPKLDPAKEAVASAQNDEIAKSQAQGLPPTGADQAAIVQRIRVSKSALESAKNDANAFGLAGQLDALIAKLEARATAGSKDDLEATRWDGHSKEQAELIKNAAPGLQAAVEHVHALGFGASGGPQPNVSSHLNPHLKQVAQAFVEVLAGSDLVATARGKLAEANQKLTDLPIVVMEAMLAHVRQIFASQAPRTGHGRDDRTKLVAKEQELRDRCAAIRDQLTTNPAEAKKAVKDVNDQLQGLEAYAVVSAQLNAFDELQLHVGKILNKSKAPNSDLVLSIVSNRSAEWLSLRDKFDKSKGTPEETAALKAELEKLQQSANLQKTLEMVTPHVEGEAERQMLEKLAILVGIAIVTWGAGAIVEGAIAGTWGVVAAAGTEAVTFTSLKNIAFETNPTVKDFVVEVGINFAMFGGLKAVGRMSEALSGGAALTAGQSAAKLTVENLVMTATQAAQVEYEKRKAKQDVTESEVAQIVIDNLALQIGLSIAGRMGSAAIKIKGLLGTTAKMRQFEQLRLAAVEASKQAKDTPSVKTALNAERPAIAAKQDAIEELDHLAKQVQENPAAGKAAMQKAGITGMSEEAKAAIGEAGAEQAKIAAEHDLAETLARLERQGPNDYLADEALYSEIKAKPDKLGSVITEVAEGTEGATGSSKSLLISPKSGGTPFKVHLKTGSTAADVKAGVSANEAAAEADWKRIQDEGGWSGGSKESFFEQYKKGLRFNFDSRRYYKPGGAPKEAPFKFEVDPATGKAPTAQDVISHLRAHNPSFEQFANMLERYLGVTEQELTSAVQNMGFVGRSEDVVRHDLKIHYKKRVVARLTDVERWRVARPDLKWDGTWQEVNASLREASQPEMLEVTRGLNSGDEGAISEEWYKRTHLEEMGFDPATGKTTAVSQQPATVGEMKKIDIDLTGDRKFDFVIHGEILVECKNGAGLFDWAGEIADYLRVASKPGGAAVKLKNGEMANVKWLKVSAQNPEGALVNAEKAYLAIEKHGNFFYEVTNKSGKTKVFSQMNAHELADTNAFRAWLGL